MKLSNRQKQQGVALVVSLIILVSLTMLGLTSIQRTTVDLAMAGNQRETGLMFQSAEMGLVSAENFIDATNSIADFDNPSLGLYEVVASSTTYFSPDYFSNASWGAASQTAGTSLHAFEQPRFKIEYLGVRKSNPLALDSFSGYGGEVTGKESLIFRSTSRGAGLTGNSFRFVQSYYGKEK